MARCDPATGAVDVMHRNGTEALAITAADSDDGCSVDGNGRFDPILPAMLAAALAYLVWHRRSAG